MAKDLTPMWRGTRRGMARNGERTLKKKNDCSRSAMMRRGPYTLRWMGPRTYAAPRRINLINAARVGARMPKPEGTDPPMAAVKCRDG